MTEVWPKWEGEVINGVFPLRRFLNGSDHSAVFLTEYRALNIPNAAIKIIPADVVLAEAQLLHWRTATVLSHPHLIRLLDAGRCQLGGQQFLYVVMEYAEETLSEILPHRALTADEVRQMLLPTLDALGFLHRRNLVQGQLKPTNFLVVNDQLKLASDTVRPAGAPRVSTPESSRYDPPEAKDGMISAAGDIWSLGVTLVEALTQRPPAWGEERSEAASWPPTLPPAFADTVQRCLSRNPAHRPTAIELSAQFRGVPQAPVVSVPQPVVRELPARTAAAGKSPGQPLPVSAVITVTVLILLFAVWAGVRLFQKSPNTQQPAALSPQTSALQAAAAPAAASQNPETSVSAPPEISAPSPRTKSKESKPALPRSAARRSGQHAQPLAEASPSVVHEQMPDVPRGARETIHGHIKVAVRVIVDASGNVIDALLENPGPSWYFARLAREAARKWKFAPADNQGSREWLLRFEFARGGVTAHATASRS
jgi:TonB family protein